jgi:uncharacterized protein YdiU (UPF0061 family)
VALTAHALARYYPTAAGGGNDALALFECVIDAHANLVARWLGVGFVHGVMNTDNTAISGETLDYGPCAFLDHYDPKKKFSSIDHGGRYAFANQPRIAQWNMARFAETLLGANDQKTKRRADSHGHCAELGDVETEQERAVGSGRDPVNPVRLGDRWATKIPACLGAGTLAWRRFRFGRCRPPVAQRAVGQRAA